MNVESLLLERARREYETGTPEGLLKSVRWLRKAHAAGHEPPAKPSAPPETGA